MCCSWVAYSVLIDSIYFGSELFLALGCTRGFLCSEVPIRGLSNCIVSLLVCA